MCVCMYVCVYVCMYVNKNSVKKLICEEVNRVWGLIFGMQHEARVYNRFVKEFCFCETRTRPLVSKNGSEREISIRIAVGAEKYVQTKN